jgi:hypothetical protein
MEQFPIDINANYGMQESKMVDGEFKIVREDTVEPDREYFTKTCQYLREKYGYTEYAGGHLEFHPSGMVTFCLIGSGAKIEDKVVFDPDRSKRKVLYPEICSLFPEHSVYIGGSSSFDFAPKKYNQSIYDEYRAACDAFFNAKTAYFKTMREALNDNLQLKRTLVERAQELVKKMHEEKETIHWNNTADIFRDMQAEWRTIGPVARKYSDEIWKQFSQACDEFFNAMRENKKEEKERWKQRKEEAKAQFAKQLESQNDSKKLYKLRDNLLQEIKTAENNILFFTAKSKNANKLVDDMQRKINELKEQLAEIKEKINQLND